MVATPAGAQSRDRIQVTGSSTVFPFTAAVAERFGQKHGKAPIVEATGTGGGMRLFCGGVGSHTPDVVNASRRMTPSEFDACRRNGVTPIEVRVGFDGIVIANSRATGGMQITLEQLYMALAAEVPNAQGQLVANPHRSWSDISPNLPAQKIEVLGPPPTSGTRDALNERGLLEGCKEAQRRLDVRIDARACQQVRADGAYVEAGENDNIIVQRLQANTGAFGIFGYSFMEENQDKIQSARIDGVEGTVDTIASGRYPLARSLFIYVKRDHIGVIPGLQAFVDEYVSEAAMGEDGYLERKGLVPLQRAEREAVARAARSATGMTGL
ncbi:phosphate ABC transporter substrate-binding protein [Phreatobacter stygius]|uniref:Phosphate ABC transporter substrate-binding protein n=2 Tax=Phreatobacter stygius TaxID=1940610 RepID=A0A4D7BEN5_9HYPH|nr:phosphate ABC transporter substrate-binding protein [Phreatobacter stygius]